jgi:(2R)-ethylmalonyl-CoA mutase
VHAHDRAAGTEAVFGLDEWRAARDSERARAALRALQDEARGTANLVPATLECARAGVTTGEWAGALREVFGDYRAPTGLSAATLTGPASRDERLQELRRAVEGAALDIGEPLRLLVGKPGLDGHSNGAEQLSLRAAQAGFDVVYEGIRHTPAEIAAVAAARRVHCVGLSVLSGAHLDVVPDVLRRLAVEGVPRIPVVVGGPISAPDEQALLASGVTAVFSSKDHDITVILTKICELIRANAAAGSTLLGQPR